MKKIFYLATVLCCSATMLQAGSATVAEWRTLGAPTFEQKVYDGTRTAVVTAAQFAISNKIAGKEDVEVVVDEASFDTAAAGIGRIITVKVKLAGSDADNYVLGVDTMKAFDQVIYQKPIAVDSSMLVIELSRNQSDFPLNPEAVVVTPAEINAVEIIDGDEVSLVTTATFYDIQVGTNKTIYAHYALTGKDAANYVLDRKMDVYSVEGEVTPAIDIKAYEDGKFFHFADEDAQYGICPGDESFATFSVQSGTVSDFSVRYSAEDQELGFVNVDNALVQGENNVSITVPQEVPCGKYTAEIRLSYTIDEITYTSVWFPIEFQVRVSAEDVLAVFNDVVGIRDMDNRYTSYQWFCDGKAIDGATGWCYQQKGGLEGVYKILVTTTEGEEYFSCEVGFVPQGSNVAAYKSFDDNIQIVVVTARAGVRYNVLGEIVK